MPEVINTLHKHAHCFLCDFKIDRCFCPYPSRVTGIHDACSLRENSSVSDSHLKKEKS